MKYDYVIGIDPGTDTGIALRKSDSDSLDSMLTMKIDEALFWVLSKVMSKEKVFLFIEDARLQNNYHPNNSNTSKWQGVGSIKRDCSIWEDFCKNAKIPYKRIKPSKKNTKLPIGIWREITRWKGSKGSQHARDAAILAMMNPVVTE